jgi:REP element-mobilizing transposase RayT
MKTELVVSSSSVGESNFHLQLTPAYRQDIFADPLVRELTLGYILQKLKQCKVRVLAYNFGPDHIHLFVANVRWVGEIELVRQIKGYSSYMMRKGHRVLFKHKLWGKKFWSEGHFYRSVGMVNKETMIHYIEECQEKHWDKKKEQKSLTGY